MAGICLTPNRGTATSLQVVSRLLNGLGVIVLLAVLSLHAGNAAADPAALADGLLLSSDGTTQETFGGFPLVSAKQDYAIHLMFTLDPANPSGRNLVEVVLTTRDDGRPALARTPSFNLDFKGPMAGGAPTDEVKPLVDEVLATLLRNDRGGLLIPPPPSTEAADQGEKAWVHPVMAWIGLLLSCLFLVLLPWTGRWALGDLRQTLGGGSWLVALAAVALAGLLLRLVVPHFPVMYYMGYRLATDAAALDVIPKYGSGALAFYHLVFQVTGTSHLVMAFVNSVIGALVPLAGAALAARIGGTRVSVMAVAFGLALIPVFIKDASTESILVPTVLWTLLGLHQFLHYRESRRLIVMAAAWVHLLLAMYSRPEAMVLPGLCLVLLWFHVPGPSDPSYRKPWAWLATILVIAHGFIAVRLAHMSVAMELEFARGNTPVLQDTAALVALVPEFFTRNLVLWPSLFPVGVLALAGLGLLSGATRWKVVSLLVGASAWLGVALVDLPYVSIARVQVPGAVFLVIASGLGAGALWELLTRFFKGRLAPRVAALVLGGGVVASMGATIPGLWAPVNADAEERLLREARAALPPQPAVFVRRGYEDQPEERLHLYYPDYWFNEGDRDDVVVGPDWFGKMDVAGRPAYFFLGTRCYMRKCDEKGLHPACRRILDGYRLEPIIERKEPVRRLPLVRRSKPGQELDFPWCLSVDDEMTLGLYRIGERNSR